MLLSHGNDGDELNVLRLKMWVTKWSKYADMRAQLYLCIMKPPRALALCADSRYPGAAMTADRLSDRQWDRIWWHRKPITLNVTSGQRNRTCMMAEKTGRLQRSEANWEQSLWEAGVRDNYTHLLRSLGQCHITIPPSCRQKYTKRTW